MNNQRERLVLNTPASPEKHAVVDAGLIIRTVIREKWTILFCAIVVTALAVLLAVTIPNSYSASARVLIDPQPSQLETQRSVEGRIQLNESVVESKGYIVKSNRVLERVIDELELYKDPEFVGDEDWDEITARRLAMKTLNENVEIRQAGISFVLNISVTSYAPQISADVANTIARSFVEIEQEAKLATAQQANAWLIERLQTLQGSVSDSERRLEDFRAVNGISMDQRISDLSQNLERLRRSLLELSNSAGADDTRQTALQERIANTEAQLRELTGKTIELRELERQADADRELYERFLERAKELDELSNFQTADSRVIVDALPPLERSAPRRKLIVILGAIFGVALGVGLVALKELIRALPKGTLTGRRV